MKSEDTQKQNNNNKKCVCLPLLRDIFILDFDKEMTRQHTSLIDFYLNCQTQRVWELFIRYRLKGSIYRFEFGSSILK